MKKDVIYLLVKGLLPADILKNPNRLLRMSLFIDELKNILSQSLDEEVKNCDLNISQCADLMKTFYNTSKKFDLAIIKHAIEISETYEDIIKVFSIGLHYRKNRDYDTMIASELLEKNLPHHVWLKLLANNDPWYMRISSSIEKTILIKTFETSSEAKTIVDISNRYSKMTSFSFNTMLSALSKSKISIDFWKEIKEFSNRKEVKKTAEEQIDQLRTSSNHKLITA